MSYAQQQRNPLRHVIGIGVVVLLHVVLIYFLVTGLGTNVRDKLLQPIETKIIKEVKPPPPDVPPPPPPPQLAAPPPPYIPPPEIQIQQPPPPNAITAVTHEAPPAPVTITPQAPKPTAPAVADRPASVARSLNGSTPPYPQVYADNNRSGRVVVHCIIESDGLPSGCKVVSEQGGPLFAKAALDWLNSGQARYSPAIKDGKPSPEEHSWTISFDLTD